MATSVWFLISLLWSFHLTFSQPKRVTCASISHGRNSKIGLLQGSRLVMISCAVLTSREYFLLTTVVFKRPSSPINRAPSKFPHRFLVISSVSLTALKLDLLTSLQDVYLPLKPPLRIQLSWMSMNYGEPGSLMIPMTTWSVAIDTNMWTQAAWGLPLVIKVWYFWWLSEQLLPGSNSIWVEVLMARHFLRPSMCSVLVKQKVAVKSNLKDKIVKGKIKVGWQ